MNDSCSWDLSSAPLTRRPFSNWINNYLKSSRYNLNKFVRTLPLEQAFNLNSYLNRSSLSTPVSEVVAPVGALLLPVSVKVKKWLGRCFSW